MKKLVRDKIPDVIRADGRTPHTRVLNDDAEYLSALFAKLAEECAELRENPCVEEAADMLEVLRAIGDMHGFTQEDIIRACDEKRARRGGFTGRIFLDSIG